MEGGELDLREFVNLEKASITGSFLTSPLTKVDLSSCSKLISLRCSDNELTSTDFLTKLPNPEKLEELWIYNNKIQPTDITIFSKFVNLKILRIGNGKLGLKQGKHNKFYGSLKSYQSLTKLQEICIEAIDIEEGLEYLPESLYKCRFFECSPHNTNAKCKAIQDQLRPFNYDLEAWQLANPEKMLKVWKEKYSEKEQIVKDLETKITQTKTELETTKTQESDKTKKIERLESKLQLLEETKTKLEEELKKEQQQHNQTKTNFQSQLRDLATILFPSNHNINNLNFDDLKSQIQEQQEFQTKQITNFYQEKTQLQWQVTNRDQRLTNQKQKITELEQEKNQVERDTDQVLQEKQSKITELTNQNQTQQQKITNLTDQIKELKLQLIQLEQTKANELKEFKNQVKEKLTQIKSTQQKIQQVFAEKD